MAQQMLDLDPLGAFRIRIVGEELRQWIVVGWNDEHLLSSVTSKWRSCRAHGIPVRGRIQRRTTALCEQAWGSVPPRRPSCCAVASALDLIALSNAAKASGGKLMQWAIPSSGRK